MTPPFAKPLQAPTAGPARRLVGWLVGAFLCGIPSLASSSSFTAYVAGPGKVVVGRAGEEVLRFGLAVWGPNWSWTGVTGETPAKEGVAAGTLKAEIDGHQVLLGFAARSNAPNRLRLDYTLRTDQDTDLTLFAVELTPGQPLEGQDALVLTDGNEFTVPCPFGRRALSPAVRGLRLTDAAGRAIRLTFDPPGEIVADGAGRIVLAKDRLVAGEPRQLSVEVELPEPAIWYAGVSEMPEEPGLKDWYPWQGTGEASDSVLSLTDWLETPAGKHGRIRREQDALLYNGRPIKLWGLNLCYGACAPEKEMADRRAVFYPRYGINSVRLHKFADGPGWAGIQSKESAAEYDPAGLDRLDYQVAKLKAAGVYVTLSAHFGTIKLGPADRRDVPWLDELGSFAGGRNRISAPHSAFFYSPEIQRLHRRQIVNLLGHRNPYTGLTYAADPAVCAVEIINEQSIFFYTSMAPLKASETLRRQVGERFSDWLRGRYGNHDGLLNAWGTEALDSFAPDGFPGGEHLDRRNVLPLGNPWYWDPAQLTGSQSFRKQRLLDTLRFLYTLQCEAYDRYVAAVREAGYAGEILGSNWQAGRAYSHFANLHSDARVGMIDRHNYFGGGEGRFNAGSMLARAGSGSLSSGLQQVDDLPFMLSEWIHVFPNEWGVEGPAIIGAYGLGLQGWDVSYLFQNGDQATFSRELGRSDWDVMAPQILGVFPAVARQVLRGDVRESAVDALRNVHVPSLFTGRLGFEDRVVQGYDDKELDSSKVPARALAVARCAVRFTDVWEETPVFDVGAHESDCFLVSSTGQLRWRESPQEKAGGFFTMDSEGTKAVVGFARGEICRLGGVTITPGSRFAAIYVTALDQNAAVAGAKRLLVVAFARARNTGMKFSPNGDELLVRGKGPVLIEPVRARIRVDVGQVYEVRLLDHDGRRTGRTLPVVEGAFELDGATDRTPYYEVVMAD